MHFFRDSDEYYKLVVNSFAMPIIDQKDNYLLSDDVQGVSKKREIADRFNNMCGKLCHNISMNHATVMT